MRTILAAVVLGLLVVAVPSTQERDAVRPADSLTRAFQAGGTISMDLSAGEYRIAAGADDVIRMTWTVRNARGLREVSRRIDVRGRAAEVELDGPDSDHEGGHMAVDIQVPARSDLEVRLTAGEVDIRGITGNKNVRLHAGEMTIEVGRRSDYRRVEASIWAGDINAGPFGNNKGGLFRSIDWEGPGQYRLEAHLKAGEINLR